MLRRLTDIQKLRDLRTQARPYAERAGIETEEDVYDAVIDRRRERRAKNPPEE